MPRHKHPDPKIAEQVARCAGLGLTRQQIAYVVGTGLAQLYEYYAEELERGTAETIKQVSEALVYKAVQQQDIQAIKFYLACRAGWRDRDDRAASDGSSDVGEDSGEIPSAYEALEQFEAEFAEEGEARGGHDAGAGEDGSVLADPVPAGEAGYRAPVALLSRARGRKRAG